MATYTGKQSVLDEALGIYLHMSFKLKELDDGTIELAYSGKRIGLFHSDKVPIEIIRENCKNYLTNLLKNLPGAVCLGANRVRSNN